MSFTLSLIISLFLDAILGDPRWYPHPVRVIGRFCMFCENLYRRVLTKAFWAGTATVFTVLAVSCSVVFTALLALKTIAPVLEIIGAIVVLYTSIAMKDLLKHSNNVYLALGTHIDNARLEIAKIVGRDTTSLNETEIAKACVETVAENMVDGITSPLFYAVIASFLAPFVPLSAVGCGAVGAIGYKAVNTMDSMFGYKNEKYLYFGRAAAKLDDIVNFLPARMSGICLIFTAFLLRYDFQNAAQTFRRDRLQHSSPNAGHPEAAIAGALGIELGGPSVYFGSVVDKPYIGSSQHRISKTHISATNKIVVVGSLAFLFILLCSRFLLTGTW